MSIISECIHTIADISDVTVMNAVQIILKCIATVRREESVIMTLYIGTPPPPPQIQNSDTPVLYYYIIGLKQQFNTLDLERWTIAIIL